MAVEPLRVVDVMAPAESTFGVEVRASTGFELLISLFAASPAAGRRSPRVQAALARVGDATGELWLHLLGLALDSRATSGAELVEEADGLGGVELRRHLLGAYVPSWCDLVGGDTIDRASRGSARAAATLLAHDRYYGGKARDALAVILPLGARETKRIVVAALETFAAEFAAAEPQARAQLEADRALRAGLADRLTGADMIGHAATGYRYEAEERFPRVVLIPHLAAAPTLLLCQHRDARLICYPARGVEPQLADVLVTLGRALGDDKRLMILERLRTGSATLADLAEAAGLAKSTAHHHIAQLRAAGLLTLVGNAGGYRYELEPAGFAIAAERVRAFVRPTAAAPTTP